MAIGMRKKILRIKGFQYPYEIAFSLWGISIGPVSIIHNAPSSILAGMPGLLEHIWAIFVTIGAIVTIYGAFTTRPLYIAYALNLFGAGLGIYGLSILAMGSFANNGVIASLAICLGIACLARAVQIKTLEKVSNIIVSEINGHESANGSSKNKG